MKSICFITNPVSGAYSSTGIENQIARYIDKTKYRFEIIQSEYAGHSTLIAQEKVKEGTEVIVAVGGDGSVNEVGSALVNTPSVLGIIPMGSGNGLARELGYQSRDVQQAMDTLNHGFTLKMDVGRIAGRYFFSNAGLGFDSYTARRFKTVGWRGFLSYTVAGLKEFLFVRKLVQLTLQSEQYNYTGQAFMLTAFNSNQYGYGIGITPDSSLQDGHMEVLLLRPFPIFKTPVVLAALLLRKPEMIKEATLFRTNELSILTGKKTILQSDGDHFIQHEQFKIELFNSALQVICSKNIASRS